MNRAASPGGTMTLSYFRPAGRQHYGIRLRHLGRCGPPATAGTLPARCCCAHPAVSWGLTG